MKLSDPETSRAVLIGVHAYTKQPGLPAVARNLRALRSALTDDGVWGLPEDHCRVVAQPPDAETVLRAVLEAGAEATDTLVVYYAGHGLIDPYSDELYLALPATDPELTATALGYGFLRRAIRDSGVKAKRKVVIVDCCYSGRAAEQGMGAVPAAHYTATEGTHVLTASSPNQRAWSPPREPYTAFSGELITLLEKGIPGGPDLLSTDTIYQHVYTELLARNRPLPQQQNRNAGGEIVIARNRAEPGSAPPARRRRWRWRRYLTRRVKTAAGAALAVAVVATAIPIVRHEVATARVQPELVPAGLTGCRVGGPVPTGAAAAYACHDGKDRAATVAIYPDRSALDNAYRRLVQDSGVPASTGDCGGDQDGEHRYPVTGPERGRVLCYDDGSAATVRWSDYATHTIASISAPPGDQAALRASWAEATTPALPARTADEKWLIDLVGRDQCTRAGVADLDDFAGAVAAVTCSDTGGEGAQSVTYYKYDSTAKLKETMDAHIPPDNNPSGPGCEEGKASAFAGGRPYDLRGVFLGVLLCGPAPGGKLVMEWSVEALQVAARAVGIKADELAQWWRNNHGPPVEKIVAAVTHQAPPFPGPAESALLKLIPGPSRHLCMRPSGEYRTEHVGRYQVIASAVCWAPSGPPIVFYYQFANRRDMEGNYGPAGEPEGNCATSSTRATGESAYSRGGTTGRLRCLSSGGYLTRIWTDNRRLIQGFAFQGRDPQAMADWWQHDAGPL